MKLFDTMPPVERFKKQLESHPAWLKLGSAMRMAALDFTTACCHRQPPDKIVICDDKHNLPFIAWMWKLRPDSGSALGLVTGSHEHSWDFTTYRKPTHGGPGRIGENFWESAPTKNALDRFFAKMNRIKEEECAS